MPQGEVARTKAVMTTARLPLCFEPGHDAL
jgi:hypothetical protein